ncbi:hypothetical protein PY254_08360 [Rhodanobacter sp. AS-Z3]|uniref:hypothetical protein n=1 Tax=Rhodanobacter sp. AS-Z3 TaxID=3031330 RepID=UPI002478446F|nr:hypothetical protein [Rhodanobacter sp. AS-Z3]WEN16666.1 hypothetical protein PY254_08360 [Rhodanobacter sp. AS-Z3]
MIDKAKPTVAYCQLWTDQHGVSHQQVCHMTEFELSSIGGGADPQWKGRKTCGKTTVMTTVLPVGWSGDWHENPMPQWIIPLSGRWSVESMDGDRREFGPGDISFGGDQHCCEKDGRKGHRSGTVGDAPAVLMLVQFEDMPVPASPGVFK